MISVYRLSYNLYSPLYVLRAKKCGGAENAGRENDGREIDAPICRA